MDYWIAILAGALMLFFDGAAELIGFLYNIGHKVKDKRDTGKCIAIATKIVIGLIMGVIAGIHYAINK
jgi:hypothetical protein